MNIIIAGCGKVGQNLAELLASSRHEVTVMDKDYDALSTVTSTVDVMGYQGECNRISNLKDAGIENANLLIAVTNDDETNMLTCLMAKKVGECKTIARIRSPKYTDEIEYLRDEMGLSMSINPEMVAADEIVRLIQIPSALEVDTFAKGKISLIGIEIPENSVLDNLTIKEMSYKVGTSFLICVVEHDKEVIIPNGDTKLHAGDKISVRLSMEEVNAFLNKIGIKAKKIKNVLIAGGGTISYYLAKKLLALRINVKIIEKDRERCEELAELLPKAMIISGDATEKRLLLQESVEDMDAVCCLMHQDEANILLSLYLGKINNKIKTITRIHRNSYEDLVSELPIGRIISTKSITADYIARYVRSMQNSMGSEVEALYQIMDNRVEALELIVGEDFEYAGRELKDISMIDNTLVCSINRRGKIIRPGGSDTLELGDSVVVVTTHKGLTSIQGIVKKRAE
ncbi:MAG: Trk system potassium transporter TrkA [Eubacterium sp.]|nr:Trk system potassium transporter TrkA [Eubacterium sp.]